MNITNLTALNRLFLFESVNQFLEAKERTLPPHVYVFCKIKEGVAPEELYRYYGWGEGVTLTKGFSVDDLRSFNETIPLPFEDITLKAKTKCST